MTTVKVTLEKGLKVGEVVDLEAEIREATAGDFIDASEESERLCATPDGNFALIASPSLVAIHILRRQIVRIGEYPGPITLAEMKKLSGGDLGRIQVKAEELDAAGVEKIADRGRDTAA